MQYLNAINLIVIVITILIVCNCNGKVQDVEIKSRPGTDIKLKEYQKGDFFISEVFEGSLSYISNRVQMDIYRISNGSHISTILYRENGKDTLRILSYDTAGMLRKVAPYENGVLHGKYEELDTLGNVTIEGQMRSGKMHGTWKRFYPEGELRSKFMMSEGVMHGTDSIWDKSGNLVEAYEYKDGELLKSSNGND